MTGQSPGYPEAPMYIGIGAVVVIIVIILLVLLIRR
jgi:hypothetical protein